MAIEDVRILRSAKLTETKGEKGSVQYTASEEFLVLHDAKNPSFAAVLADETVWPNLGNQKIPQIDDKIAVGGKELFCTSRDLSYYQDNERALVLTLRYDVKDEDRGGEGDPSGNDPEAWKRIAVQSVDITVPARGYRTPGEGLDADLDRLGEPALNSAGDPVDGLEEQASMLRFTYTNTIAINPDFNELKDFTNTCNFNPVTILGVSMGDYTLRCTGFNAQYDQKNNTWNVTVEFLYNPNTWKLIYYDVGFNEVVNGKRVAILDARGNPVSSPVALDGSGRATAFAQPEDSSLGAPFEPATKELFPYPTKEFALFFQKTRI